MPKYSRNDLVLVRYPFTDLSDAKVRPAIGVSAEHISEDIFIVPLTSKVFFLLLAEFFLIAWAVAGLNVPTAVKRGIYTIKESLAIKSVGKISIGDAQSLQCSLKEWLAL